MKIDKNRIGIFTPSLGFEYELECLEFVKQRGGLIQAWTLSPELAHEVKPGISREKLIGEAAAGNIRIASLSGYMDWTEPEKNLARQKEFKQMIHDCAMFDTSIICTETGRCFEGRDDERAWKLLTESMRKLCAEAEAAGVKIAIEMGRSDLVFGVDLFRKLQDRVNSDALKINFDPANLRRGELDPRTVLEELKNEVVQVHLKDAGPDGMAPLTHGDVDFIKLFDILESNGYSGNYIIEQEYAAAGTKADAVAADYQALLKLASD